MTPRVHVRVCICDCVCVRAWVYIWKEMFRTKTQTMRMSKGKKMSRKREIPSGGRKCNPRGISCRREMQSREKCFRKKDYDTGALNPFFNGAANPCAFGQCSPSSIGGNIFPSLLTNALSLYLIMSELYFTNNKTHQTNRDSFFR